MDSLRLQWFGRACRLTGLALLAFVAPRALAAGGTIQDGAVSLTLPATYWGQVPAADLYGTELNPATDIVYNSGWWYRVEGDTREYPLPAPDSETFQAGEHAASWSNLDGKGLRVVLRDFVFDHEGPSGGYWSRLFVENNGPARSVAIFHYLDADLGGDSANDYGAHLTDGYLEQTEVAGNEVLAYKAPRGFNTNAVTGVMSIALFPSIRTRLLDSTIDDFFPSTVSIGPGDVTAAYEFKATLQNGDSFWSHVTVEANMPGHYLKGAGTDFTPFPSPLFADAGEYHTQLMRRSALLEGGWTLPHLGDPVGVDDFDHDFTSDVLYRSPVDGALNIDGQPVTGAASPPLNWVVAATGDFGFDGHADILWRNTTSQRLVLWIMNGTTRMYATAPTPDHAVDANWDAVGVPDVDADGNRDILWYNQTTGKLVIWYLASDLTRISGGFTDPPSVGNNNWRVVSVGDYGKGAAGGVYPPVWNSADIVWQNDTSHKLVVWFMDTQGRRTSGMFTTPDMLPGGQVVVGPR